jgi:hypothetical protein
MVYHFLAATSLATATLVRNFLFAAAGYGCACGRIGKDFLLSTQAHAMTTAETIAGVAVSARVLAAPGQFITNMQ